MYMFWLLYQIVGPRTLLRQLNWSSWSCHPTWMPFWWQSARTLLLVLVSSTFSPGVYRSRVCMLRIASKHTSLAGPYLSYFIEPKQAHNLYANTTNLYMPAKSGSGKKLLPYHCGANSNVKLPHQASNKRRCHLDNHGTCRADQGVIDHCWANQQAANEKGYSKSYLHPARSAFMPRYICKS